MTKQLFASCALASVALMAQDQAAIQGHIDRAKAAAGWKFDIDGQVPEPGTRGGSFWRKSRPAGIHRKIAAAVPSFALVPQLVIGTTRITTIHRRLAVYYARHLPLRVLKPPIKFPPLKEEMRWHAYRETDPGLR